MLEHGCSGLRLYRVTDAFQDVDVGHICQDLDAYMVVGYYGR